MSSTTSQLHQDRLELVADQKLKLERVVHDSFDITKELAETINHNLTTTSSLAQARLDLVSDMNSKLVEVVEESFDLTTELFGTINQKEDEIEKLKTEIAVFNIGKTKTNQLGDRCMSNSLLDSTDSLKNTLADLQSAIKRLNDENAHLDHQNARLNGENVCLKKENQRLWDRDSKQCQQIGEGQEKNGSLDNTNLLHERYQARTELAKLKWNAGNHLSGCRLTKEEEQLLAEQNTDRDDTASEKTRPSRESNESDWLMIV